MVSGLAQAALTYIKWPVDGVASPSAAKLLTREEARRMAEGLGNKAIARELNVAEGTIKLHLHPHLPEAWHQKPICPRRTIK